MSTLPRRACDFHTRTHRRSCAEVERYKRTFDKFDLNKDGKLNSAELTLMLREYHVDESDSEVKKMIEEVDYDTNGTIECEEFLQLMGAIKCGDATNVRFAALVNGNGRQA
eukprot:TRINITY_DN610_c0_g1_i1.p1 TRINITY_DN610_c0_g1~~TRINITY_DN610_c0_g1_i1.p1  ORF type:complete len:111 (+),score=28.25 TRINITY_DN610_c0_g1_i1:135-467(+)